MPGEKFIELVELMRCLRAPGGCPWDRKQTHESLKPYLLEEAYEVLEAIDNRDDRELREELGDLLLQVVFHAQIAAEENRFTVDQVAEAIHTKLVRRHPHVFGGDTGGEAIDSPEKVKRRWGELKDEEKRQEAESRGAQYVKRDSLLDGVSRGMPALLEAFQLTERAAFAGFDWPSATGILDKMEEEIAELRAEIAGGGKTRAAVAEEVGDLLFTAVNLARGLGLEPESTLRRANRKFRTRFQWMEARLAESGRKPSECGLEELEALWQRSKRELAPEGALAVAGSSQDWERE